MGVSNLHIHTLLYVDFLMTLSDGQFQKQPFKNGQIAQNLNIIKYGSAQKFAPPFLNVNHFLLTQSETMIWFYNCI